MREDLQNSNIAHGQGRGNNYLVINEQWRLLLIAFSEAQFCLLEALCIFLNSEYYPCLLGIDIIKICTYVHI